MKFTSTIPLAVAVATATAYPITGDNVNCRSGPGTSYSVVRTYSRGHDVTLTCQTEGTDVFGITIWDKTTDGCFVSDYYVKTNVDGYVTGKCEGTGSPNCPAVKSSQATVELIAGFEGFEPEIYPDLGGKPTVGYGHLCNDARCSDVKYPIPLSERDGQRLLADDMARFERCVTTMVRATVNMNQYGALVSWAFNMGCPAAEDSTLVRRLNAGENVSTVLSEELPRWVHMDGKVVQGLVNRRNKEIAYAAKLPSAPALPARC